MTETHVIDCDAAPFIPSGWSIADKQLPNRVRGSFIWDPASVRLFLPKGLDGDKHIKGYKVWDALASEPVLPTNVLDYLLKPENQYLIPEEWKGKSIWGGTTWVSQDTFFWGTLYRQSGDELYVRCLCHMNGRWDWNSLWVGRVFNSKMPALVRAG